MAKKKKRLIDQIYNGAFENAILTPSSKKTLINSAALIVGAGIVSFFISRGKL